jgi:nitroreductase
MPTDPVLDAIMRRKSIRAFEAREISRAVKDEIISATLRAPTAGNMMLYSIIEVQDQSIKDALVRTCDNQSFIARSPWVLLFLADYQRWFDYFLCSGVERLCAERGEPMRRPEEGDLVMAFCDALIAAQTAVIAAEALGVASCYIGDITEHYEVHRELFGLPQYAVPVCMLCLGYATAEQRQREPAPRFDRRFLLSADRYRRADPAALREMFEERERSAFAGRQEIEGASNFGQLTYRRKFDVDYAIERNRSVREILKSWRD